MVINNMYRKFDIKEKAVGKLEELINGKCRMMRTDNIWFEKPIGNIMCANYKHGYFTFVTKEGKTVFPRFIKGHNMTEMITTLRENQFFTYIETEGKHLKFKPKKKR